MDLWRLCCFILLVFPLFGLYVSAGEDYVSAIGDPGMRRDGLRVAIEAWNQCNEVGEEAPSMGSPRMADCFDVTRKESFNHASQLKDNDQSSSPAQKYSINPTT
ncbi:hypothetical protein L1049_000889 [Liquidambar formosana]|uniref:DUF7705 domain-containing protein n=1 Tax=Liquidambar formosana TaxID=63359 RepID=A0AAP0NCA0_LIQFO